MSGILRSALPLAYLLTLGCQTLLGFEELEPESAGGAPGSGGSASGAGGGSGAGSVEPCPGLENPGTRGTVLIKLERADGRCFFVDTHEVTNDQYQEFANDNSAPQSAECSWNDTLIDAACLDGSTRVMDGPTYPIVCVDQCDAQRYCEWAGKELCHSDKMAPTDEARDDWYSACSNQGETAYPYGNSANEDACNVLEVGDETTWEVDVGSECESMSGVRDLIGNVWEWVGGPSGCSRARDADDECLARGASFAEQIQRGTCDELYTPLRGFTADNIGFRCCAYPD